MAPPGFARSPISAGRSSGPSIVSTSLWPCARSAFGQRIAVDAFDRLLARRIDRRDDRDVGIVQAGAELLEQIAQARVAMRLHDGDDRAGEGLARRLQHGGDLDRMVAVIVDDGGAVPLRRRG